MEKIIIFTDGASRGNPGPAALGAVICNEKEEVIKKYFQAIGRATNNEAEYQAVIFALKKIKLLFGKNKAKKLSVLVKSDSELLVSQLIGKYKIKEENIKNLFIQVWNLKTELGKVDFQSIPREQNKGADGLANQALNEQSSTLF